MTPETVELTTNAASKITYGAGISTVVAGFTINEWGVIVGIIVTISMAAFNVWFKFKYQRGTK